MRVLALMLCAGSMAACGRDRSRDVQSEEPRPPSDDANVVTPVETVTASHEGGRSAASATASTPHEEPGAAPLTLVPAGIEPRRVAAPADIPVASPRPPPASKAAEPPPRSSGFAAAPSRATSSGHVCFSWRTRGDSSTHCYRSIESCNAERRALGFAADLTPCRERTRAVCTSILRPGERAERHCFGDSSRCAAFREQIGAGVRTTHCVAEDSR